MFLIVMGILFLIVAVVFSVTTFISGVASVMKIYEVINDSWFVIWQFPLITFVVWTVLIIVKVIVQTQQQKSLDKMD